MSWESWKVKLKLANGGLYFFYWAHREEIFFMTWADRQPAKCEISPRYQIRAFIVRGPSGLLTFLRENIDGSFQTGQTHRPDNFEDRFSRVGAHTIVAMNRHTCKHANYIKTSAFTTVSHYFSRFVYKSSYSNIPALGTPTNLKPTNTCMQVVVRPDHLTKETGVYDGYSLRFDS